ncbi:hypothetical protein M407DRAFT_23298 [Tulasnella calospora MUT 4182]|uniref:Uncharacterized protein n=1 Tax=Tulasnella calospora MUT 4182 TaxID=1051891 RepID=A0A0C3QLH8_9AGAM|nr:hypothetical protein M407DRAFT_23298 [Tulasnella calospora MUT 4182]
MASPRSAYSGSDPKLVVAIDIGTTYSGASYTFLKPEEVPRIWDVGGFKGQEDRQGNSKVPSELFYSLEGDLVACGARISRLEPQEGIKTKWFKLGLRPPSMLVDDPPPVDLPPGRTVIDAFGDFLKYMYDCVKTHIINTHVDGHQLWSSLNRTTQFVLSHPNGWGDSQWGKMREAAIRGGLVPNTPEGHERVEFVTEGEASFHWCIDKGTATAALKEGAKIVVVDLGGGTIDVSSFLVGTPKPLRLSELKAPECALAGSITVTERFMKTAIARLQGTPYGDNDYIEALREEFDQKTKCIFHENTNHEVYVRIGSRREHFVAENGACRIEAGHLEVQRQEIVDAFEPSVTATVNAIRTHLAEPTGAYVFLVGGFSASPWMLSEIRRRLDAAGIKCPVKRADNDMAKAASSGGVAFYLDRHVTERIMRHTYGVILDVPYHPEDPEHQDRNQDLKVDPNSGKQYVRGGFFALVTRGQLVKVDRVYKERGCSDARPKQEPIRWNQTIQRYSGEAGNVTFIDTDPDGFTQIGSFYCDIPASAMTKHTKGSRTFWAVDFNLVITLGTVEMKAYVEWEDQGVKKRTRAMSTEQEYY